MTVKVGILGAGGRMGTALIAAVGATPGLKLAGLAERAGNPAVGMPVVTAGGGKLSICANASAIAHNCDVLIDFTTAEALADNLEAACAGKCAILVGTTGLDASHQKAIDRAARSIAVLQAANTSLGVTVMAALVERAATLLGSDWDIEISELHHKHKRDAPSGTALALGAAAARGRGVTLDKVAKHGRARFGPARAPGEIGFVALRGGSAAGDHDVLFAGEGERLVISHHAEGRELFARGAVAAAAWLGGKPAGRYTMAQVLGL